MERVYSTLVLSTPREAPEAQLPRPKPLEADTCLVLGLVDMVTVHGVFPFLVFIFTTPDAISPYSTEGTPVITSTDSTLDEAMLLVDTPLTLLLVVEASAKEALLDRRTPSTSTAVPKEELPPSEPAPARMLNCLAEVRLLDSVAPPGSRLEMSNTFISCTCSRAVLSMVRAVVAELPSSRAVTTAFSRVRLSGARATL